MIPKPDILSNETSYRPISLLPVVSNLFEKLLLKSLKSIIGNKNYLHISLNLEINTTVDQTHRIRDVIEKLNEEKNLLSHFHRRTSSFL